jgi:hypothetical protein
MRAHPFLVPLAIVVQLLALSPVSQALDLPLEFDNFSRKAINDAKWIRQSSGALGGVAIQEIRGGQLRLVQQITGDIASNSGTNFNGSFLNFARPNDVRGFQARVQVKSFTAIGCAANPEPTGADARLFASFFNSGIPTPGSFVNDVTAELRVIRLSDSVESADILRVIAQVIHCSHPNCSAGAVLFFQDLGPITTGQWVTLKVEWQPEANRVLFQRDSNTEISYLYSLPDTSPPGAQFNSLFVSGFAANCTVPGSSASVEALFDDVRVRPVIPLTLPFAPGEVWYVCVGYRASEIKTHASGFALDLSVDADSAPPGGNACASATADSSTGESIVAPGSGEVLWIRKDLLCLDLDRGGSMLIGHLEDAVLPGRVEHDGLLGNVAPPDKANGDYAHIHVQAHSSLGCAKGTTVPFDDLHGTRFENSQDLPDLGSTVQDQWYATSLSR